MAENTIPLLPPTSESGGAGGARDQQEFDILKRDSELKRLEHRDKSQRYTIKWIAVVAGVVVILCMFGILAHMFHHVFWGPIIFTSPALSVAMVVSPIVSITTITVAIFIGAFRKFDDKDLETFGNGTMGAINAFKSGSGRWKPISFAGQGSFLLSTVAYLSLLRWAQRRRFVLLALGI